MKSIAWIVGIVGSGLLIGHLVSRVATHNANAAPVAAVAAAATPAASTPYKVGDRLAKPAATAAAAATAPAAAKSPYREILWDSLMPADWDPMLPFKGLKLDKMQDGDPRATEALWKAKKYWNNAPMNPKINDVAVKIPGFVVSLEREGDALKEFLLVPYYGGCIHVPPPPANQIIHVHSNKAIAGIRTMDAVWISGTMKVGTTETMMGVAGYSMLANNVELYTGAPGQQQQQ